MVSPHFLLINMCSECARCWKWLRRCGFDSWGGNHVACHEYRLPDLARETYSKHRAKQWRSRRELQHVDFIASFSLPPREDCGNPE
jgi:hypothetical protein